MQEKRIIVKWSEVEENVLYPSMGSKEMRVISSDHERFTKGTRFDYGFMNIAINEGYIIEVHPLTNKENNEKI